jgi:hypothetical protein
MEVHHHPHAPTHSKPWKEYLLEGLMIFIAVSLGYAAENIREHTVETKRAVSSTKNLYKDVLDDSVTYANVMEARDAQDRLTVVLNNMYDSNQIKNQIPKLYAIHNMISLRMLPVMNALALDDIKSSGVMQLIEDEDLKTAISNYSGRRSGLSLREQREYSYIDRMLDPITTTNFKYKYYNIIASNYTRDSNDVTINVDVPKDLTINKASTFDWDNYLSIIGMLKTIRSSTNESYIKPTQKDCATLLGLLRKYLKEHDALEETKK